MQGPGARLLLAPTLMVAALGGLTFAADRRAAISGAELPMLRGISSRLDGRVSTVIIESTEPVAYVTSQPDPLTVLVDLRNVRTEGVDAPPLTGPTPVRAVALERTTASDGAPVARVRVNLERAVKHRVRSTRNVIRVEVEPGNDAQSGSVVPAPPDTPTEPLPSALPPTPVVLPREDGPVVTNTDTAPVLPLPAMQTQQPMAPGPPPGAPGPAPGDQQVVPPPPRFTGHPVSLDFQGADLRAVLRTFSEISGLNLVIDPSITGTVDVSLRDVPWDQALDIILKANKLGYSLDGTIVRIAPLSVLADEEAERRKLAEAQALAGQLSIFTRSLSYAKAQELVPILTRSALSSRGEVQVDARTKTLIIRDLPDRLQAVTDLLGTLDRP